MLYPKFQLFFFLGLFVGVIVLTFLIFLPFLNSIALAVIFAVVLKPFYNVVVKLTGGKRGLASMLTIVAVGILILAPATFLGMQVFQESKDLYYAISIHKDVYSENLRMLIEKPLQDLFPQLTIDINYYMRQLAQWFAGHLGDVFSGTLYTIINLFLGLISLYYFLKDGKRFTEGIVSLSPLADRYDRVVMIRLEHAMNSVIKGSLFIAILQGLLAGVGLSIFGVPSPTLWGSIAAICALIPGLGTALVIAPAVFYLFFIGSTYSALGLLIWGIIAVGLIDNFLGPILIGRGISIHPLLILFSVVGGIAFFGPIGFLLGPLVVSLLFALIDIYRLMILKRTDSSS